MKNLLVYGLLLASSAMYSADAPRAGDFLRIRVRTVPGITVPTNSVIMPVDNIGTVTGREVTEWLQAHYKGTGFQVKNVFLLGRNINNVHNTLQNEVVFNSPANEYSGITVIIDTHQ
jgi:hypothetical protein